jgi:Flp pilus assembly protein TadD
VHQHDAPGAITVLDPLVRARPDDVAVLNLTGYALVEARTRLPDAERYLRHARELAPGDPAILDSWGWLLLAEGKPAEALAALEHAVRFAPLETDIVSHRDAARQAARATIRP